MKKMILILLSIASSHFVFGQNMENENDSIVDFFEISEQPSFPGGVQEMMKFISENTEYPKKAMKDSIQGTVMISFVVDKDGSITSPQILKDQGGGLGDEALRVVNLMPKWIPGKQKGDFVRVKMMIPFRFRLNK